MAKSGVRHRGAARLVTATLVATVLAGCGSTVKVGSVGSAGADSGSLGLTPVLPGTIPSPGSDVTPGSAPVGSTPSSASISQGATSGPAQPTLPPGTAQGPTTTRGTLSLGILYTNNDAAASAGVNNGNTFTLRSSFEALVKAWNGRGGLAGRKIVPIYAELKSSSTSIGSDLQAACTKFTQDNHVAAVLSSTGIFFESFVQCLTRAHTTMISADYALGDDEALRAAPGLVAATTITVNARLAGLLEQLSASGRLRSTDKLGIVVEGCPFNVRAYESTVVPVAKRLGVAIADRFDARCFQSLPDLGGLASEMQNAVLRFKARGVTQVAFVSGAVEGNFMFLFATAAQSQGFQPNYALTSAVAAQVQEKNTPKAQLARAVGYGWLPTLDSTRSAFARPAQRACIADLHNGGLTPASGTDRDIAFNTCDTFRLYDAALTVTNGLTDQGSVLSAVHSLGTNFAGAETFGGVSDFRGGRRTGPGQGRLFVWSTSCGCFDYTGQPFSIQ